MRAFFAVPFTLAIVFAAGPTPAAEFTETFTFDAETLALANLVGEVVIQGHTGPDFEVEVRVLGEDASEDLIRFRTEEGTRARLLVEFPVREERTYIYPRLGRGSSTHFSFGTGDEDEGESSFWDEVWKGFTGKNITVKGSGDGLEVFADVTVRVPSDSRLNLRLGVGEITATDVTGDLDLDTSSGAVTVQGVRGEVMVDTGSGNVEAAAVKGPLNVDTGSGSVDVMDCEGDQSVDTGSGEVTLENCRGDEIHTDTGSGGVRIRGVSCSALLVDTGSGSIHAHEVEADQISLDTGSGSVELTLDRLGSGDVDIDTGSGSIFLALPENSSVRVEATTSSGGIDVEVEDDLRMIHDGKHEKSFMLGEGASLVVLDTGSGSIRIVG
jgi:DUF4097 and DUF4098 domain-containing protein YvlB